MPNRTARHDLDFQVGFRGDERLFQVINRSSSGMLIIYDGKLQVGDEGVMDRMDAGYDDAMETRPMRFQVIRRENDTMAIRILGIGT